MVGISLWVGEGVVGVWPQGRCVGGFGHYLIHIATFRRALYV